MEFRTFRDTDYEAVCTFLIELNRTDRTRIHWNWARFEWMYEHPEFDKDARDSIGLWWNKDRIVGAAIYDMYFGEAFCGVLPGWEALYPQVLDYAYSALKDEKGLGIALCDTNLEQIAAAKQRGFAKAEQTENVMAMELDGVLPGTLPERLSLTSPDPIRDARALQWLFWRGFDHGEDREEFEREEAPLVSRPRPHFDPDLSLAAADPSGELVGCCCLWYSPGTDYAYVEPVCVVPAWRGKGLGKALVQTALHRAKKLGAKRAYVISDLDFYRKLGFETACHYTFYWKP